MEDLTLLRDPEVADLMDGNLVVEAIGGRSLVLSVPGWQVVGPEGSINVAPRNFGYTVHNSTDSGPTSDSKRTSQAGGSSQSLPSEPKGPVRPSGRRWHRIRKRQETSHSGQPAMRSSKVSERKTTSITESAPGYDAQSPTDTTHRQDVPLDNSAGVSGLSPASNMEKPPKIPPLSEGVKDDLKPESTKNPVVTKVSVANPAVNRADKAPRQNPATKSVEVEVVLPARDIGLSKGANWKSGSRRLSPSGDVTGEEVRQWVGAGWRQLTRHIKPPEVCCHRMLLKTVTAIIIPFIAP